MTDRAPRPEGMSDDRVAVTPQSWPERVCISRIE